MPAGPKWSRRVSNGLDLLRDFSFVRSQIMLSLRVRGVPADHIVDCAQMDPSKPLTDLACPSTRCVPKTNAKSRRSILVIGGYGQGLQVLQATSYLRQVWHRAPEVPEDHVMQRLGQLAINDGPLISQELLDLKEPAPPPPMPLEFKWDDTQLPFPTQQGNYDQRSHDRSRIVHRPKSILKKKRSRAEKCNVPTGKKKLRRSKRVRFMPLIKT